MVPRERILDLLRAQCRVFSATFNPQGLRLGNKILRQRLKGPSVAAYYPPRTVTHKDIVKAYPEFETWDDEEEDRLEAVALRKARGKGAPKKKRTAEESKRLAGKKKR